MSSEGKFWIRVVAALLVILVYLWWKVFSLTGILWWNFTVPDEERKAPSTNEEFVSPYLPADEE